MVRISAAPGWVPAVEIAAGRGQDMRTITVVGLAACAAGAHAQTFTVDLEIDQLLSNASAQYGLGIFQQDPVFLDTLESTLSGSIRVEVQVEEGFVNGLEIFSGTLNVDEDLTAVLDADGVTASATLSGLSVEINSTEQSFFTPSFVDGGDASWGGSADVGFTGLLDVVLNGFELPGFDLSEQSATADLCS